MAKIDLSYPAILKSFGDYVGKGRTESQAFLAWFLEHYYRLEATEVDDAICDSNYDKGIDGIYVNDLLQQIDVFQTKIGTKTPVQSLGDTALKEFLGTLTQLSTPDAVQNLIKTAKNPDLETLLTELDIATRVKDGFEVRGIFITNRTRDAETTILLSHSKNLVLYDKDELEKQFLPIDKPEPIATPIAFNTTGISVLTHKIENGVELFIAPLLASELVKMDGLANQELFSWNLRYQLKRSPVNREISKSITDSKEHKFFPAFHNGLTVLAERITSTPSSITIEGYAVVNGCQSLSALYSSAALITPDLRILTKIVSVSPKSELALKITDHTNRQNGITGRDLQSNNSLQTRLQSDIHKAFPGDIFYRIARGEHPEWNSTKVIENDEIAKVLLAFDVKEPESCHQSYKLFDELHSKIFGRPEVNAGRVVALWDTDSIIRATLPSLSDKQFASYSLTPYLVHFLLREVLELPESGAMAFCHNPEPFISKPTERKRFAVAISPVIKAVVDILGAEMKRRTDAGTPFDHKKDLKSPGRIRDVRSSVVPLYQMAVNSKFAQSFGTLWVNSATP